MCDHSKVVQELMVGASSNTEVAVWKAIQSLITIGSDVLVCLPTPSAFDEQEANTFSDLTEQRVIVLTITMCPLAKCFMLRLGWV